MDAVLLAIGVEVVAALTTVLFLRDLVSGGENLGFSFQIILWLWFTVLFANFAEAVAEGRGKAQADALRRTRREAQAKLLTGSDQTKYNTVPGTSLKVGDVVLVEAGDIIPSDGEVIEGVASVNAIDGQPVDVAFLLVAPTAPEGDQLNALACVARTPEQP